MGHSMSKEESHRLKVALDKTSKMELRKLEEVFHELSFMNADGVYVMKKPNWLTQESFAEKFQMPELFIEQLFQAFDKNENETLEVDEFLGGMALCLHGTISDKCRLLFKVFNLNGDDGINKDELSTMLSTALESAHVLLNKTLGFKDKVELSTPEKVKIAVQKIVDDAFRKCDLSKTGKLEVKEFERWVHKHPKLIDSIFVVRCPQVSTEHSIPLSGPGIVQTPEEYNKLFVEEDFDSEQIESSDAVSIEVGSEADTDKDNISEISTELLEGDDPSPSETGKPNPESLSSLFQSSSQQVKDMEGVAFFDSLSSVPSAPVQEINIASQSTSTLFNDPPSTQSVPPPTKRDLPVNDPLHVESNKKGVSIFDDSPAMAIGSPSMVQPELSMGDHDVLSMADSVGIPTQPILCESQSAESPGKTLLQMAKREAPPRPTQPPLPRTEFQVTMAQPTMRQSYSAWNPSPDVKKLIQQANQGKTVDHRSLTHPSVLLEQKMTDPVRDLVIKFLGEQELSRRTVPNIDTVTMNDAGLKDLLRASCWRSALEFTTKYLKAQGQGIATSDFANPNITHTPKLLQVWQVRVALLFKLHMFSSAEAELTCFGDFDRPDLYYEFYPDIYPGKKGCMVPFSLRILNAEMPQFNGRPNETLDRLYQLLSSCRIILSHLNNELTEDGLPFDKTDQQKEESLQLWQDRETRILYSIANCFCGMKEYNLAVKCYEDLIRHKNEDEAALRSGIGRMLLQLGNVKAAEMQFEMVQKLSSTSKRDFQSLVKMNSAFFSIAKNQYEEALKHFEDVSAHDLKNIAAKNNAAVCMLFLGKVKAACATLESALPMAKAEQLHEDLIMNTCTTYELETSKVLQQKHKLLDLVSRHKGDGFNIQCLKLT